MNAPLLFSYANTDKDTVVGTKMPRLSKRSQSLDYDRWASSQSVCIVRHTSTPPFKKLVEALKAGTLAKARPVYTPRQNSTALTRSAA